MIFGSKALAVAVLGALVFSDEASAARMKKGGHDNNGLRKVQRELKGKSGGEGKGKGSGDAPTRADADEEETVEVIIDAVIDNKAGDVGGDDIAPDAMQTCDPIDPVDITFGSAVCKYQYTANAPTRICDESLLCTKKSDITMITFKYTSVDGAEGGRVLIVDNVDDFQSKLSNVDKPVTYEYLKWFINEDLDTAVPKGKTLYNEAVWVGDEFLINVDPMTRYDQLSYFAFDKHGILITTAILNVNCNDSMSTETYKIGDLLGNSMITSFKSTEFGVVTSTVFIDSYEYTVNNNCDGDGSMVYSLDRTVCTSPCGEDKWECPTAEGYNPFPCVAGGDIQLGCGSALDADGSQTSIGADGVDGSRKFFDSIDGKGPIDLLETKVSLKVDAKIKYPDFWTMKSTPEGGVNNRGALTSIDACA